MGAPEYLERILDLATPLTVSNRAINCRNYCVVYHHHPNLSTPYFQVSFRNTRK